MTTTNLSPDDNLESRWPKDSDRLFQELAWANDAYIARNPAERFYRLPMGYKRAGDILLDHATFDAIDRSNIIYATLFCYRQAIEIFLKQIIDEFSPDKIYKPKYTHELSILWERYISIARERRTEDSMGVSAVQKLVMEMHNADQMSDGFRFPTDKSNSPFIFGDQSIDLANLREVMAGLTNFFECAYLDFSNRDDMSP